MISIHAQNLGKAYNQSYIFEALDLSISAAEKIALLGPNGSGKSTLLKCLMGIIEPTKGEIRYTIDDKVLSSDVILYIGATAPYMQFEPNMLVRDLVKFYYSFKSINPKIGSNFEDVISQFGFTSHQYKKTAQLSSGLIQRLKLILIFGSTSPLLFLDEPCSNLDQEGVDWYQKLIHDYGNDRTIIVASNRHEEYEYCSNTLLVTDYKK